MGYQGWANYETWAVALWIDNDLLQGMQERALEIGRDLELYAASEALRDWTHEDAPDLGACVYADLLRAALGEVDWRELAEHYAEQAREIAET